MAAKAGLPLAQAIASMEMAHRLDQLPATAETFRDGRLSEAQAREISAAAVECPKCHLGYRYRGRPGTWTWIPPDQPTDPPHLPP
jgi:hypothetical protein